MLDIVTEYRKERSHELELLFSSDGKFLYCLDRLWQNRSVLTCYNLYDGRERASGLHTQPVGLFALKDEIVIATNKETFPLATDICYLNQDNVTYRHVISIPRTCDLFVTDEIIVAQQTMSDGLCVVLHTVKDHKLIGVSSLVASRPNTQMYPLGIHARGIVTTSDKELCVYKQTHTNDYTGLWFYPSSAIGEEPSRVCYHPSLSACTFGGLLWTLRLEEGIDGKWIPVPIKFGNINHVAISDFHIAVLTEDQKLHILDHNHRPINVFEVTEGEDIKFSPTGDKIAVARKDRITIFDLE